MGMIDDGDGILRSAGNPDGSVAAVVSETRRPAIVDEEPPPAIAPRDETIFTILAGRARSHELRHLWLTAAIGGIDAVALTIARPSLWWVAAACASVGAYATWGIADRALVRRESDGRGGGWSAAALHGIRGLAVGGGIVGAIAAVIGFLGVALGNSGPPG